MFSSSHEHNVLLAFNVSIPVSKTEAKMDLFPTSYCFPTSLLHNAWHLTSIHHFSPLQWAVQNNGVKKSRQKKFIPVHEIPEKISYIHATVSFGWSS